MSADGVGQLINFNFTAPQLVRHILIFFVFAVLAAICTAAITAAVGINDKKLGKMAEDGNRKAKKLKKLLDKPTDFTESLNVAFYVIFAFGASYAAVNIFRAFSGVAYMRILCFVPIMFVFILMLVLFGYLVPKKVASQYAENMAVNMYPVVFVCFYALGPFVWALKGLAGIFSKIFGVENDDDDGEITEEEIRLMVDVGEEKGVIPENEKMMINNIFEFNDTTVNKIMTHRVDMVAISKDANFGEILKVVSQQGYTRIPVFDGTLDNIKGILHTKSLISYVAKEFKKEFVLSDYIIKPYFVPQSKTADELFEEMQKGKMHMAVVVDEYGGTAGIVTMEDLIESILGNIQDEYDDEETEVICVDENTYLFSGSAELGFVCDILEFEIPEDEKERFESDTLGGFVTGLLDKIPCSGDSVEFANIVFEVIDADDKKINRVKAVISRPEEDED